MDNHIIDNSALSEADIRELIELKYRSEALVKLSYDIEQEMLEFLYNKYKEHIDNKYHHLLKKKNKNR